MKTLFVDAETTGLDETKHAIWSLSGMIEIDGVEKDSFDLLVRPDPGDVVAKEVLEMNGWTMEQFREKMAGPDVISQAQAYQTLMRKYTKYVDKYDKQDKMHFAAFNATFDDRFKRRLWERNGDQYYGSLFWWPPVDVAILAGYHLRNVRHTLVNFKQETVAKHLGIEVPGDAHDSLHDVRVMREIYRVIDGEESANAHV